MNVSQTHDKVYKLNSCGKICYSSISQTHDKVYKTVVAEYAIAMSLKHMTMYKS